MADADMTSMVGFPLTYDGDAGGPAYTAQAYRLTAGAAHAIPDGTAFGGVQGVRAGSPTPLVGMDGTTATVSPHMGWLCPWSGAGVYEYAITRPVQATVGSSTGSYKIAVVLADQAAGHGTGERVSVQSYSGSTDDRMIDGLVIATVTAGVASDTAPRLLPDATLTPASLAGLQRLPAADGVKARMADGSRWIRTGGAWAREYKAGQQAIFQTQDAGSFVMPKTSRVAVCQPLGLLYVDLSSFHSNVTVKNFPLYQYAGGPRPSTAIDLGALGIVARGGMYAKSFRWDTNGIISCTVSISNGDDVIMQPTAIPIPDGITFV